MQTKFIVTHELGRLAKWLRILGFDTAYEEDKSKLVIRSLREGRAILTRDTKMSRFTGVRIVRIKSDFVEEALSQTINELGLKLNAEAIFKICVLCNKTLEKAMPEEVEGKVPAYVFKTQKVFLRCPRCGKIYWQGTHWDMVSNFLKKIEARGG